MNQYGKVIHIYKVKWEPTHTDSLMVMHWIMDYNPPSLLTMMQEERAGFNLQYFPAD